MDHLGDADLAAVGHQLSREEFRTGLSLLVTSVIRCPVRGCELGLVVKRVGRDRYWLACGRRHRFQFTFAVLDPLLQAALDAGALGAVR